MGAFELGLSHAFDRSNTNLAYSRQLQDEQRQQNLQRNWGILNDPSATDDMKQAAGQDIQNQYPTPEHKGTFLSDILHIHSQQPSAQPIPPSPSPANPISGAAPPISPAPAPSQGAKDPLGVPYSSAAPPSAPPAPPATPMAAVQAAGAAPTPQAAMDLWRQYRGPVAVNEGIAENRAKAAAGFAQDLEKQRAAAGIQEATIRSHGNVSMQKLDAAAQSLGADDFSSATPDIKMQAMKNMASANRAPAWKSVTDGNSIYAVNSLDPTQKTLLGHKDDLTQRQEFRTMTNPDGSTFLVPVTVWSKKGSSTPVMETQDDQGGAPVSASTPQGPGGASPVPAGTATPSGTPPAAAPQSGAPVSSATPQVPGGDLAAVNASIQSGNANSKKLNKGKPAPGIPPSTVGAPIAFGGKINPLDKADVTTYEGLNKEAVNDTNTANFYEQAYQQPGNKSAYDTSLVTDYTGVLAKGGRKTQAEIGFAQKIGGFGLRLDAMLSKAQSGELPDGMRQLYVDYLKARAKEETDSAQNMRGQIQQNISPGKKPRSNKTPSPPSPPRPAGVPANAVWNAQGHNGAGSWQMPQ